MLKIEMESFRLINALFRDNILFIYFKTTEEIGQIFKKLRNLYIRYKIVAFNQEHSEFELIKKSAVNLTRSYFVAELELDQVQSIERPSGSSSSIVTAIMNAGGILIAFAVGIANYGIF